MVLRRVTLISGLLPLLLLSSCSHDSTKPNQISDRLDPPAWVATWGDAGVSPGPFSNPTGVAVASDGTVFVVDNGHARVTVTGPDGELLGRFGQYGYADGQLCHPMSVAVAPSGLIYVGGGCVGRVQRFTASWDYDTTLAFPSFPAPVAAAAYVDVDSLGFVYVVQTTADLIAKYAPDGSEQASWSPAVFGGVHFEYLSDLAVAPDGSIFVLDSSKDLVYRINSAGDSLTSWAGPPRGPGKPSLPTSIDIDEEGRVLIADRGGNAVHVFDTDGDHLVSWGETGSGPGQFDEPEGVSAGPDGLIYVSEVGNDRVQVFRWQ